MAPPLRPVIAGGLNGPKAGPPAPASAFAEPSTTPDTASSRRPSRRRHPLFGGLAALVVLAWLVLAAAAHAAAPAAGLLPTDAAPAAVAPSGAAPLDADPPAVMPAVPAAEQAAPVRVATPAAPPAPAAVAASAEPAPPVGAEPASTGGASPPAAPVSALAPAIEDAVASLADGVVVGIFGQAEPPAPPAAVEEPTVPALLAKVEDSVRDLFSPIVTTPASEGPGTTPPSVAPASSAGAVVPIVRPVRGPAGLAPGPVTPHAMGTVFGGSPPPVTALPGVDPTAVSGPRPVRVTPSGGAQGGAPVLSGSGVQATPTSAPLVPLGDASSEPAVLPAAVDPAAGAAPATPRSMASAPPAPAGAAPGPLPEPPRIPTPAPNDPTGLAGLPGGSSGGFVLGVAALCVLIGLARPPRGMRPLVPLPAPYVPAAFLVSLERPG